VVGIFGGAPGNGENDQQQKALDGTRWACRHCDASFWMGSIDWRTGPSVKAEPGRFSGVLGEKRNYRLGTDERKRHDPTSDEIQATARSGRWKNFSGKNKKILKYFYGFCKFFLAASSPALPTLSMPT
jgi:hypothetical protein